MLFPISMATLVIVSIIGGMLLYGYQTVTATSVAVNFAPQVRTISQVFSVKADPRVQAANQTTIREGYFTYSNTKQRQGNTTGKTCPIPVVCQQAVSPEDVSNLANQIKPSLDESIIQELQGQISAVHGRQVGQVNIFNQTETSSPQINQPGDTVTVTLTEEGSVGYIVDADATRIVQQQLQTEIAQQDQGFQIVDSTMHMGKPVITGIDSSGVISIKVQAGVVAVYQFNQNQLQQISNALVGKSLTWATAFLKNQQGIDPASVHIHFTSGKGPTLPSDIQHIRIIPIAPETLPSVSLTPVHGIGNGN